MKISGDTTQGEHIRHLQYVNKQHWGEREGWKAEMLTEEKPKERINTIEAK